MKNPPIRPSALALVVANLVPLFGVLFLDWKIFPIIFLFWMENVVIGAINVLKMLCARPADPEYRFPKFAAIPFFCVHYGMFCFVHGIFVVVLFGGLFRSGESALTVTMVTRALREYQLGWALLALAASHCFSFVTNYLRAGEFRRVTVRELVNQPYARVIVLHVTLLLGAFLMAVLQAPGAGLVLLVVLKIGLDLSAHLRERRKYGAARVKSPVFDRLSR